MEKKDIALLQLRTAAQLYNKGNYICAITLAGAAEEILGKISKKRTGTNEFEKEIIYLKSLYKFLDDEKNMNKPLPDDKTIINHINKIKNELKHNDSQENIWIKSDFESDAVSLFIRAVKNYFNCYNEMPKDKIIMNLFEFLTL